MKFPNIVKVFSLASPPETMFETDTDRSGRVGKLKPSGVSNIQGVGNKGVMVMSSSVAHDCRPSSASGAVWGTEWAAGGGE